MTSRIKDSSYTAARDSPLSVSEHKDKHGSLYRNVNIINYKKDKDNIS